MAIQTSVAAEPMSYPMTEEDRDMQSRARALSDELLPHEVEAEMNEGRLAPEVERRHEERARELGFGAINMPKELGGGGFTTFQQVLVQEQIGRPTNALGWVVHTPAGWLPKVASKHQRDSWVIPTIRGERGGCRRPTSSGPRATGCSSPTSGSGTNG